MEIVLTEVGLALILGLAVFIAFFFMNLFKYTLAPKTYDETLSKLKSGEKVSSKKKSALKSANFKDDGSDTDDQPGPRSSMRRSSIVGVPRFKRAESIKNDHVVFADEVIPNYERFEPGIGQEMAHQIEGILQNKAVKIGIDPHGDEKVKNAFETIQPLDDLGLEIRRKSLQVTPCGSQSGSHRGSRSDLNWIGKDSEDEALETQKRILKFAQAAATEEEYDHFDCKKFSKILRKSELSIEEINILVEILLKKEEQSTWVDSSGKNSVLLLLKREIEAKDRSLEESNELIQSLQAKLKQIRGEFSVEKSSLGQERDALQREVESLQAPSTPGVDQDRLLKEIQRLKGQLTEERDENAALNKSILEQQGIIKTALKRIYPSIDVEHCEEHQKWIERFVENMKKEKSAGDN